MATFLVKLRPLLLPLVRLPAQRLPLALQLAAQHTEAQLHALPLLLLLTGPAGGRRWGTQEK